jgi:hypothetical protein
MAAAVAAQREEHDAVSPALCRTVRREGRWHVLCTSPHDQELEIFSSESAAEALEYATTQSEPSASTATAAAAASSSSRKEER